MPRGSFHPKDAMTDYDVVVQRFTTFIGAKRNADQKLFCRVRASQLVVSNDGKIFLVHPPVEKQAFELLQDSGTSVYSVEELLEADFGARVPVIDGLIHEGETVVVGGRPKVGKSRIVHQIALSLLSGEKFLGMDVPRKRNVLLCDLENGKYGIQDRIRRMGFGSNHDGLHIAVSDVLADPKLTNTPEGLQFVTDLIQRTDAEVLIIDPWRLWLGGDENNGEHVVNGLKALSSLRGIRPKLAIMIVHHVRKENTESPKKLIQDPRLWSDNLSGHHALISHAHAAFGLERRTEDDDEEMIVFGGISRNIEPKTLILEEDESTLRFDVCRNETAASQVMTKAEREIWKKAKSLEEFRFGELEKASGTKNKKAITSMLRKAVEHGVLLKVDTKYRVL